jgi:endonuclease/exonuclease/phosphatase family metal-dependent hydrolase
MKNRALLAPLLLLLTIGPAHADGPDVLAGAYTVAGQQGGRSYTGRLTVTGAAGDTYDVRGDVRFANDPRAWRVSGGARPVTGGFRVESTITAPPSPGGPPQAPRSGAGVFRLSADALAVDGSLTGARSATESWRRVDRAGTVVLKVMTFNILGNKVDWLKRQGKVAAVINAERPDIVFMQEVPGQTRTHSYHVGALARLTGMHGTFRGHHRTGPFGLLTFGNAILSRGSVSHSDSIELPKSAVAGEQRSVVYARVEVRPGVKVNAFSTHLTTGRSDAEEAARQKQVVAALRWFATFRDRPLLFAGDFNARPTSPTTELLTGRRTVSGVTGRLRDGWLAANMPGTGATFGEATSDKRIDYIFWDPASAAQLANAPRDVAATGGVRVLRAWTRGENSGPDAASDHRALVMSVEMAR